MSTQHVGPFSWGSAAQLFYGEGKWASGCADDHMDASTHSEVGSDESSGPPGLHLQDVSPPPGLEAAAQLPPPPLALPLDDAAGALFFESMESPYHASHGSPYHSPFSGFNCGEGWPADQYGWTGGFETNDLGAWAGAPEYADEALWSAMMAYASPTACPGISWERAMPSDCTHQHSAPQSTTASKRPSMDEGELVPASKSVSLWKRLANPGDAACTPGMRRWCRLVAKLFAQTMDAVPLENGRPTSTGSLVHACGKACRPCLFVSKGTGCFDGLFCNFCHFSGDHVVDVEGGSPSSRKRRRAPRKKSGARALCGQ
eukprot:CAMPEP_0204342002 /NCGR_PEP_ID=MMETSP0469-20131031/23795_1 /ASSEMBLY_ACC=CAM_ASM_000384 /TAXON_ID=2969 /ORGANISM="Oxyrrhis marina" /LENGTH=315 /DNA_ID=CAMNT_0051326829 /DNA_START=38 /DNA_END=985 /DNA_ORIENTATION=+